MYLWAPFILQNLLRNLRVDSELWGCAPFSGLMAHLFWAKIFWYKPLLLLSSTYWLLFCAKFKKILTADPELWRCTIFGPKVVHLPQAIFFWKNYYYHSHLTISALHCAKFKKNSSSWSRVMRKCNVWTQNGPFPQMIFFPENLLMSLVYFIHAYLHAKNQSQILIY